MANRNRYIHIKFFFMILSNKAVTGIAAKYNVPVIMDCDFGHLSPSMPIVSGAYTQVKVKDNDLSLNYRFC